MPKKVLCAFGVHVDAVAGWLGTYGGEDSVFDISQGLFAGEVGTDRVLKLFEKHGIRSTWYVSLYSANNINLTSIAGSYLDIPLRPSLNR
jgi:peptidoglycan/xylan/chitin deacetylase (PgdA/CDA1 family)